MNEPPREYRAEREPRLDDEELRQFRSMLREYEGRKWFRKLMKERIKTWGLWIAIVTGAVGLIKGVWVDWIGRH